MTYDELLEVARKENVYVIEKAQFKSHSAGLINGDVIGLNKELSSDTERACILAEELGHYYTSTGNIIDQDNTSNRKQELHARVWAYRKLLALDKIIEAFEHGCRNRFEMAEYLEVTEEFLSEAINRLRDQEGPCLSYKDYIINLDYGYISKKI